MSQDDLPGSDGLATQNRVPTLAVALFALVAAALARSAISCFRGRPLVRSPEKKARGSRESQGEAAAAAASVGAWRHHGSLCCQPSHVKSGRGSPP